MNAVEATRLLHCTVVTRRNFDPEATPDLIERDQAAGLGGSV